MEPATTSTYLRSAQVAELLGVSRQTVHRWSCEGTLPSVRILGSRRRYPEAAIRELAELMGRPNGSAWLPRPPTGGIRRMSELEQLQVQRLLAMTITDPCPVKAGQAFDGLLFRLVALRARIDSEPPGGRPG